MSERHDTPDSSPFTPHRPASGGVNTDIIPVETAGTLYGLFLERLRRSPQATAFRYHDAVTGQWRSYTWQEAGEQVSRWQKALAGEGFSPGDRVALMLRNRPEWAFFDLAALGLGLVVVPLYTNDRPDNAAWILEHSGARLLLFGEAERWPELRSALSPLRGLRRLVCLEPVADPGEPRLRSAGQWLPERGEELAPVQGGLDDLATVVYTSGTTGRPKGVMLSHRNILSNAHSGLEAIPVSPDDSFLSFLPLSHMLERTVGYYVPMMAGATVAYARGIPELGEDLVTIRPTCLISVPRIYERVYAKIQAGLREKPFIARLLFHWTVAAGWRRFEYRQGRAGWHPALLAWPLLKRLVADKVIEKLGGRLRIAISGGAALPPTEGRAFIALGVPILQGYGLTETSPIISVNRHEDNLPASVGVPLPGVEVRIGEQKELLSRGPNVMLGYWHNEEATAAVIDQEGWFHTGDQARLDQAGHIFITGRLKEIIVLANGEKISPADMETHILADTLFDMVMVLGEQRPFLAALVLLNPERWHQIALREGLPAEDPNAPECRAYLVKRIGWHLKHFPGYARIHRIAVITEEWSVENGMLTPTLKLKRGPIAERYAEVIEQLYEGH